MASITSIALSGMQAAQASLNTSAHNVANVATPGFHRHQTVPSEQAGGGVQTHMTRSSVPGESLATDVVAQLQAKNAFLANLRVFKTGAEMADTLLDSKK